MKLAFLQRIEQHIEQILEKGSDDDLFASSYLEGHLSLAVARCELEGKVYRQDLLAFMTQSLEQAFVDGELSEPDQSLVLKMWNTLQGKAGN